MSTAWPMWSVYEDEIDRRGWSKNTVRKVRNYLSRYRRYCGGQQPSIFLAAEFLNKEIADGRMSQYYYVHSMTMLDTLMRESGYFHFLGDSFVENKALPDQRKIFEALWANRTIAGVQAVVVLRLFSKGKHRDCWESRVREYDREKSLFLGKYHIPHPYSLIIEDQIRRIELAGGNENSFMCPMYNRVTGALDLSKHRGEMTYMRSLKRMSSTTGVDFHWLCTASDAVRMRPRGAIVRYRTRRKYAKSSNNYA